MYEGVMDILHATVIKNSIKSHNPTYGTCDHHGY